MKYVFIALISACVCVGGLMYAGKFKKREECLQSFCDFLNFALSEMQYSCEPVFEIVEKYARLKNSLPTFLKDCQEPVAQSVRANLNKEKLLTAEEKALIESFFDAFGKHDETGSLHLIEHFRVQAGERAQRTKTECHQKQMLVKRLSVLAALATAVILL